MILSQVWMCNRNRKNILLWNHCHKGKDHLHWRWSFTFPPICSAASQVDVGHNSWLSIVSAEHDSPFFTFTVLPFVLFFSKAHTAHLMRSWKHVAWEQDGNRSCLHSLPLKYHKHAPLIMWLFQTNTLHFLFVFLCSFDTLMLKLKRTAAYFTPKHKNTT